MLLFVLPFFAPLFGEIQEACAERPAVRRQAKAVAAGEVCKARSVELGDQAVARCRPGRRRPDVR